MKSNRLNIIGILCLACIILMAAPAMAKGIKERMKARLPVIVQLKQQGIIGENYFGYLEFVTSTIEQQELVNNENADRKKIYAHIAKKEGASVEQVGIRRARQIVENAEAGEFLKNKEGRWYRKGQ
ncbi:MAG: DUF1318 domain-containing protein [Desulfobacteraceae bacterium]|nr:MAG: DUF1318 domain-containing protein [Desulfobacteraceae bacterium]